MIFSNRFAWTHDKSACLLLVAATFTAYCNIFCNQFLFDDQMLIVQNSFLRHWYTIDQIFTTPVMAGSHTSSDFYRPLQVFLYLIVVQIEALFGGLTVIGFHLLNLALHSANACLLYRLGCKLNFKPAAALAGALLWALHPIHTEAVTYMSGTADMLYSFFCLWSLIVLAENNPRKILVAVLLQIAALLSKESAVMFPLLAALCLFLKSPQRLRAKTYFTLWPLFAVSAFYLFTRFVVLRFNSQEFVNFYPGLADYGTHIGIRIATFLATLPAYAGLLLWPTGLHMERIFPVAASLTDPRALAGTALLAVALALAALDLKCRPKPAFAFGLGWFAVLHLPQSGILVPVNAIFLEHWMYLPTAGLALGIAQSIAAAPLKKIARGLWIIVGLAAVALGLLTLQQNRLWHDPVIFYKNILRHGEVSVRARNNLGLALMDEGRYQEALDQFQAALAIREAAETHQNIASAYSRMPGGGPAMVPQEKEELEKALALDPDYLQACEDLAYLYRYLRDPDQALKMRERCATIRLKYAPN